LARGLERRGPVLLAERRPSEADRELTVVLEEPAAGDRVVRGLELEEEELPSVQNLEPAAPRVGSPEVDLVEVRLPGEEVEPVLVSGGDEGSQRRSVLGYACCTKKLSEAASRLI